MRVINIDTIDPLPTLSIGEGNFFAGFSIEELARKQDVKPLKSISILSGGIPEDVDVEELLREIYSARKRWPTPPSKTPS
jgi:hypothetical protein